MESVKILTKLSPLLKFTGFLFGNTRCHSGAPAPWGAGLFSVQHYRGEEAFRRDWDLWSAPSILCLSLTPTLSDSSIPNVVQNSRQWDRVWGLPTHVSWPCRVLKIQFQPLLTNTNLCGKGTRKFGHGEMSWGKRKGIIHLVMLREEVVVVRLMCLGKRWDCGILHQLKEIFCRIQGLHNIIRVWDIVYLIF